MNIGSASPYPFKGKQTQKQESKTKKKKKKLTSFLSIPRFSALINALLKVKHSHRNVSTFCFHLAPIQHCELKTVATLDGFLISLKILSPCEMKRGNDTKIQKICPHVRFRNEHTDLFLFLFFMYLRTLDIIVGLYISRSV